MEDKNQKKPRILCLHEFRTSGEILKKLVLRWPEAVTQKLDLVFLDGHVQHMENQTLKDFSEYRNFEEFLAHIEDYMVKNGPCDGLLGFSQGVALGKVNKIQVPDCDISGAQFGGKKLGMPKLASNAFSKLIDCPSLTLWVVSRNKSLLLILRLRETDFMKPESIALLEAFVEPVVIHHPKGHRVPRLDDKSLETMLGFIEKIQRIPSGWSRKDLMNLYRGLHVGLLSFL